MDHAKPVGRVVEGVEQWIVMRRRRVSTVASAVLRRGMRAVLSGENDVSARL
jgi:hypothetical protein